VIFEFREAFFKKSGICNLIKNVLFSRRCGGKDFEADINSNGSVFIDGSGNGIGDFYFAGKTDVPGISFLKNCSFFNDALDLSGFSKLDPANFREIGLRSFHFNSLGIAKAIMDASFFKSGIARSFSLFNVSEKVFKSTVEVFKSLLEDLTVDFLEPGELFF